MVVPQNIGSAGRFFEIAEALCAAIGKAVGAGFIAAALALMVVRRIQRVRRMLLVLEARYLAGRVLRRQVTPVTVPVEAGLAEAAEAAPPARQVPVRRMPLRFGWLCPLVPGEAACFAGQMRVVLAEPGMQDLLAACPQAVRLLRPLCRMLGIERAAYVPPCAWADEEGCAELRPRRRLRVRRPRMRRVPREIEVDLEAEDAHFAFTGVPRRFRLRPRPG